MDKPAKSLQAVQTRLADNLRRIRQEKGIQQERLAWESGVDRSYYGRIERAVANPSLNVLIRLADLLEVDISELLVSSSSTSKPARDPKRKP